MTRSPVAARSAPGPRRGVRRGADTSRAPRRSRAAPPAAPSVEEGESQFPFVGFLVLVALGEDVVGLVFAAHEDAPREVVAYTAADIGRRFGAVGGLRSEEHTSELQSPCNLVCRLLLEKKNDPFIAPNTAMWRSTTY